MPINLLSAGGGTTTLTTASSGSNFTVTIPAATGSVITTPPGASGNVLTSNGSAWVSSAGSSGKVLQVVQSVKTDTASFSSSSFTALPGYSASITPSSTSSKILVLMTLNMSVQGSYVAQMQLTRNSTAIFIGDASSSRTRVTFNQRGSYNGDNDTTHAYALTYLDSPSTTSSVAYSMQGRVTNGQVFYINRGWNNSDNGDAPLAASSIILMEIAA